MTALSVVLCAILSPVLGLSMFLPQVLTLIPVLLLALLGFVGPVSAAACSAVFIAVGATFFGGWGALCVALLLVPVVIASAVALEREQPFWQAVFAGGVAMFASMGVVIALLTVIMGSDVVTAISQMMTQMLDKSGALGDSILAIMMQVGLLAAPQGAEPGAGAFTLDPQTRTQLIGALVMATDSVLRLEIPMQMATGSVTAGLLGQAALRKGMLRRGEKVDYPRLATWHVPKGWGRILGGTLAALYVLARLVPSSMTTMFYVFSGVFNQVFALQGVAALCYMLEKRGKSRAWQRVVFVLGYFFLGTFGMMLGIADQAMDFSHRREELDQPGNPFDPRQGA